MNRWMGYLALLLVGGVLGYALGNTFAPPQLISPEDEELVETRAPVATEPSPEARGTSGTPDAVVRAVDSAPPLPETMLDNAAIDLDLDGAPERVELYAAVQRDDRGRLMWDDGQRWTLIVRDGDAVYPLFDGYVQLGKVTFWLVDPLDGRPPAILTQVAAGAGVRVERFIYSAEEGGFVSTGVVEASGNVVHETPAEVAR